MYFFHFIKINNQSVVEIQSWGVFSAPSISHKGIYRHSVLQSLEGVLFCSKQYRGVVKTSEFTNGAGANKKKQVKISQKSVLGISSFISFSGTKTQW